MNLITQASFHRWLDQQPDTRKFHYMDHENCLIASYVKEIGAATNPRCGGSDIRLCDSRFPFPDWLQHVSCTAAGLLSCFTIADFRKAYGPHQS